MNTADTRWPFAMRPLTPKLGAAIVDVTLADAMSDDIFAGIHRAFLDYQVLLFPAQDVPPERQVALARRFGEVQIHVMNQYHADGYPELYRLSNLDADGRPNGRHPDKGTLAWHTDGSWRRRTGQATIIRSCARIRRRSASACSSATMPNRSSACPMKRDAR
jgi:taurine dioxygenase